MREIKFLVWIWEWTKWEWCDFKKALSEDYIKFNDWLIEWQDDSVIIRQYTWLKDKNWKKIFEWDILKWSWNYIWEIIYDNDFLQYRFKNWRELDFYWVNNLEIIWNIYENPELLNK